MKKQRRTQFITALAAAAAALILLYIGAVFAAAKLGPAFAARHIKSKSGFTLSIQSLTLRPLRGTVKISGLRLENPPAFPVPEFIDMPEALFDLRVKSLAGERLVAEAVRIQVDQVTYAVKEDGQSNLEAFLQAFQPPEEEKTEAEKKAPRKEPHPYLIETLDLRLAAVRRADHSKRRPRDKTYPLDLHISETGVTDVRQVASTIISAIAAKGASFILDATGDIWKENAPEELQRGVLKSLEKGAEKTGEFFQNLFD